MWYVLGWCTRWRREVVGRRGSRRKEDQGIWLHRYFGAEAVNPVGLSGADARRGIDRDSTLERRVWKIPQRFEKQSVNRLCTKSVLYNYSQKNRIPTRVYS